MEQFSILTLKSKKIEIEKKQVKGIYVNGELQKCDILISGADYYHTESLDRDIDNILNPIGIIELGSIITIVLSWY